VTILVAYSSRYGSTRGIADRIAATLRTYGSRVDVHAVNDVVDLIPYDAVIVGGGVYDGSWTVEAVQFMRRHSEALARRPVWLFSVGTFGDRHPVVGRVMKKEPREINEFLAAVHPRDYRVFAGVIDADRWPRFARVILRAFGGRPGDNRNWADIEEWAGGIGRALAEYRVPAAA
jgi:menaquinone-dependent protoporphyrinogen oxidase